MSAHQTANPARLALPSREASVLVPCQRHLAQSAWAGRPAAELARRPVPTSVFALANRGLRTTRPSRWGDLPA